MTQNNAAESRADLLAAKSKIKFETYRFYLQCLRDYMNETYGNWRMFAKECAVRTQNLCRIKCPDTDWIGRFMKMAWNTEYLLGTGSDDLELVRFSNAWRPVQAYYSVYASSEAIGCAIDGQRAKSHRGALKKVTKYLVEHGMSPWDKAYQGPRGRDGKQHRPVHFPPDMNPPHNLKRVHVDPLAMIGTCLRAEHSHRIDELWERKGRRVLKYEFDPGYTGILHFLYRLRIKSNYKDVDIFVAEAPDQDIRGFAKDLEEFCHWTLLHMEILLIRRCGKRFLTKLACRYIALNSEAKSLTERKELYEDAL